MTTSEKEDLDAALENARRQLEMYRKVSEEALGGKDTVLSLMREETSSKEESDSSSADQQSVSVTSEKDVSCDKVEGTNVEMAEESMVKMEGSKNKVEETEGEIVVKSIISEGLKDAKNDESPEKGKEAGAAEEQEDEEELEEDDSSNKNFDSSTITLGEHEHSYSTPPELTSQTTYTNIHDKEGPVNDVLLPGVEPAMQVAQETSPPSAAASTTSSVRRPDQQPYAPTTMSTLSAPPQIVDTFMYFGSWKTKFDSNQTCGETIWSETHPLTGTVGSPLPDDKSQHAPAKRTESDKSQDVPAKRTESVVGTVTICEGMLKEVTVKLGELTLDGGGNENGPMAFENEKVGNPGSDSQGPPKNSLGQVLDDLNVCNLASSQEAPPKKDLRQVLNDLNFCNLASSQEAPPKKDLRQVLNDLNVCNLASSQEAPPIKDLRQVLVDLNVCNLASSQEAPPKKDLRQVVVELNLDDSASNQQGPPNKDLRQVLDDLTLNNTGSNQEASPENNLRQLLNDSIQICSQLNGNFAPYLPQEPIDDDAKYYSPELEDEGFDELQPDCPKTKVLFVANEEDKGSSKPFEPDEDTASSLNETATLEGSELEGKPSLTDVRTRNTVFQEVNLFSRLHGLVVPEFPIVNPGIPVSVLESRMDQSSASDVIEEEMGSVGTLQQTEPVGTTDAVPSKNHPKVSKPVEENEKEPLETLDSMSKNVVSSDDTNETIQDESDLNKPMSIQTITTVSEILRNSKYGQNQLKHISEEKTSLPNLDDSNSLSMSIPHKTPPIPPPRTPRQQQRAKKFNFLKRIFGRRFFTSPSS